MRDLDETDRIARVRHMNAPFRPPGLVEIAIFAMVFCVFAETVAKGEEEVFRHEYPEHSDTFVKVLSVFGSASRQGTLPFRVTIRNHSGKTRTWTVRLSEGNYSRPLTTRATYQFTVENGTELETEVTLPFAPAFRSYDYRNLEVSVSAQGLPSQMRSQNENLPVDFPLLAISRTLGQRSIARLDQFVRTQGSNVPYFAKLFTPDYLPKDWLGYTGLDAILIDKEAYDSRTPAQSQALTAWIRLGGEVHLFRVDDRAASGSDGKTEITDETRLSLGRIVEWNWNGNELPDGVAEEFNGKRSLATELEADYDQNWALQQSFGTKSFNPVVVFLLLFVFAVLVAPVNLFYFAKPGRRHRLFITTPIISVATCLLIVLVILFIDGVGGRGYRVVIADLQPGQGEGRMHILQEQISRTGVMIAPGFETTHPCEINPVNLPPSHFNPFSSSRSQPATLEIDGARFDGPYFRSRSEQGFVIRSSETSRTRIELQGVKNGIPDLISNLSGDIRSFFYRDPQGKVWTLPTGTVVSPGQRIPVEEANLSKSPEWVTGVVGLFGKSRRQEIQTLYEEPNRFFAVVANPDAFVIPTHPWIQWAQSHVLLTGTPAGSLQPSSPSSPE